MSIELVSYESRHAETWDAFCNGAANATFLHTRRFLSYHGERFKDLSLLVMDSGKMVGVFPAAQALSDPGLVVSHPGITYGGLVHQGKLAGNRMIEALEAIVAHYAKGGYRRLHYKPLPFIYAAMPTQDDLYALFRLGGKRVRSDLSCCIDLAARRALSERRRRGLKKAQAAVTLSSDPSLLGELWGVVAQNLARKHDARPVHTLEELNLLHERFPQQIQVRCALLAGVVEAGVVFFNAPRIWHAQYIAASEAAYEVTALDAVFDAAIVEAQQGGALYFDFGTSNEEGGKVLNDGLYRFKSEFGGGGVAHEFYELDLK
ncbi:MAG: GNAT family N-acetyltransferase [Proteobacteria bacterium]|nr:GNAT family N-acetyltransferase [Pseudomonadota bacterium]